jgi:hypothetical protein
MLEFALAGGVSLYFRHRTRQPNNVILGWHNMTVVPRIGDRLTGPMGDWRVYGVTWNAQHQDDCAFASIDVLVENWEVPDAVA